jgi:hypothetical protein
MNARTVMFALLLTVMAGVAHAQIPPFTHVFVIVMENHEYEEIIGNPSAPYVNALAQQYGVATSYFAVTHPSLPNYMALTAGDTFFDDDCVGCTTPAVNLLDSIDASGLTWTAYLEDMPAPCTTTDSGLYVARHDPFVHYDDIAGDAARCSNGVIPSSGFSSDLSANVLASFVWITPNVCNDMHDCSIDTGDAWLQSVVPQILQSAAFANSVLFIVWDEGTTTANGGGHIPLIVASPMTPPGTQSSQAATHFDLLRTIEDAWGLPPLGQSANATALSDFFPPPPAPPGTPDSPGPGDGATGVDTGSTLSWAAAGATRYDVSFDTVNPPTIVSTGQAASAYTPAALATNTTYYWQVVAYNDAGATTGPVWSFTTADGGGAPPTDSALQATDYTIVPKRNPAF